MTRLHCWLIRWRIKRRFRCNRAWMHHGLADRIGVIRQPPKADSRDKQAEFQRLMRGVE